MGSVAAWFAKREPRRTPQPTDRAVDGGPVRAVNFGSLEPRIQGREGRVSTVQLAARGLDLPVQFPVLPDHSQLNRRPATGPRAIHARSSTRMKTTDGGDRRVWTGRATTTEGQLQPDHIRRHSRVVGRLPAPCDEPRQGGRANSRDQQDQRNGDEQRQRDQEGHSHPGMTLRHQLGHHKGLCTLPCQRLTVRVIAAI